MTEDFYNNCEEAVLAGDADLAEKLAEEAVSGKKPILEVIENGFVRGIRKVGRLWEEGTYFLPELVMGAEAVKKALAVLEPVLARQQEARKVKGVVVMGTVEGDIHDIGKTLVSTMLSASGFDVYDLGTDVSTDRFIEEAENREADLIGASALLTTTMQTQKKLIEVLSERGERERYGVILGGAPCSREWAKEIGADGYAKDAVAAVDLVEELLGGD